VQKYSRDEEKYSGDLKKLLMDDTVLLRLQQKLLSERINLANS
jgi:hypothetical protein